MRQFIGFVCVTLIVVISPDARCSDSPDASVGSVPQIRNLDGKIFLPHPSRALMKLLLDTKAMTKRPITFNWLPPNSDLQGYTHCGTDTCQVYVHPDYSKLHTEAVMEHELEHIQLDTVGYGRYGVKEYPAASSTEAQRITLRLLAGAIPNCYLDAIIDRRLRKIGLDPSLDLVERNRLALMNAHTWTEATPDDIKKQPVVNLFCSSLRMNVDEQYSDYAITAPSIVRRARALEKALGHKIPTDPEEYYRMTIKLRDAANVSEIRIVDFETGETR